MASTNNQPTASSLTFPDHQTYLRWLANLKFTDAIRYEAMGRTADKAYAFYEAIMAEREAARWDNPDYMAGNTVDIWKLY